MSALQYDKIENLGFLSVIGPDSKKFLQGQSSCQFNEFEIGQQKLGSFSDAKGRVFANFNAIAIDGGFLLQMHKSIIEHNLTTLKKYAAFFKVTLSDVTASYEGVVFSGDLSSKEIIPKFDQSNVVQNESGIWVFHNEALVECWAESGNVEIVQEQELRKTGLLEDYFIEQGLPWLTVENIGEFVAQMLNLELIDAIDFKKGCYTGQEIIARLHYKGKSKKRLMRVAVPHALIEGVQIVNAQGKVIGLVVNSAQTQALISANINEEYYLKDNLDTSLELLDLPYQF